VLNEKVYVLVFYLLLRTFPVCILEMGER